MDIKTCSNYNSTKLLNMWPCRKTKRLEATQQRQSCSKYVDLFFWNIHLFNFICCRSTCRMHPSTLHLHWSAQDKIRVKQQFDRRESLKMLLYLFLMECLALVHVTRLTLGQPQSSFKSHSAKTWRGRFCVMPSLPMNRKSLFFSPSSPVTRKSFFRAWRNFRRFVLIALRRHHTQPSD